MFTCVYIASKMFFLLLRCKRSGTSKNDMLTHCLDTAQKSKEAFQLFVESFQNGSGTIRQPEGKISDHAGMFRLDRKEAIIVIVRFHIYLLSFHILSSGRT